MTYYEDPVSDDSLIDWRICPVCGGHGQPQGDGSGWDGASMHTPACEFCDGRGEVPACTSVHESCHGDDEIDQCTCPRSRP